MRFILLAILPFLADAAHNPPYLRHHKRVIEHHQQARAVDSPRALEGRSNAGHADAHRVIKRVVQKRGQQCRAKATSASSVNAASPAAVTPTAAPSSAASPSPSPSPSSDASALVAQENWAKGSPSSTTNQPAPSPSSGSGNSGGGNNSGGLLHVTDGTCGYCQSSQSAPNGAEWWLNCGVDGAGWTPPYVTVDQLVAADLTPNNMFAPCASYIGKFKQYAAEFNVPPIMLASFAMQESTCNAGATGGNGEAGLMQIAPPNCNPPAGTSCWDVDYNIRRGAQLLSEMIQNNGGNVIAAVGAYNGWQKGLTIGSATAAKSQGHCFAQNNLDYLTQFFNGWMQDKNGYSLGTYFNLRGC